MVTTVNYSDVTGGLNLRADPFQIDPNQSPRLLNVEVDPAGGVFSRKGFEDYLDETIATWDPRTLYAHVSEANVETLFVANDGDVYDFTDGDASLTDLLITATASPHGADFASWGSDVYIACGRGNPSQKWVGGTMTSLGDPEPSNWATDGSPTTDKMPEADFVASHQGRLWVASTDENGTQHRARVRFSYANDPGSWEETGYFDFDDAGGPITGIAPFHDHLLVFFEKQVWAIYGWDAATWQRTNITRKVGAHSAQVIQASPVGVFFVSWPEGVYVVGTGTDVVEVSAALRPAITSTGWSRTPDEMWLSWADQRLWWAAPYAEDAEPDSNCAVFMLDPSIPSGAWTMFRSGDDAAVSPIVDSIEVDGGIGTARGTSALTKVRGTDTAVDTIGGVAYDFNTAFRTRWINDNWPTRKKGWRRPDVVLARAASAYDLTIAVFHDYDGSNAKRTRTVGVAADGNTEVWYADPDHPDLSTPPVGAPVWSAPEDPTAVTYGPGGEGSAIRRLSALGSARAVQLEMNGEPGQSWGVNALVFKYKPRSNR